MTDPTTETDDSAKIDYAARRYERRHARGRRDGRQWALFAVVGLAALLLAASVIEAAGSAGRVHRGVTVSGIDVGGMKPAEAKKVLTRALDERAAQPVVVTDGKQDWAIKAATVGLAYDFDSLVADAMKVGRRDAVLLSLRDRAVAWGPGIDLPAEATAQEAKLDKELARIAGKTDASPVDAMVVVKDGDVQLEKAKEGRQLNRTKLAELVLIAFASRTERRVEAPIEIAKVDITDQEAQAAASVAKQMLSAPATITYAKKKWEFDPAALGEWIAFRAVPATPASGTPTGENVLEAYVSEELAADPVTKSLGTTVGRPAKDARFRTSSGRVTIEPSQDGIGPDVNALALALTDELKDSSADRVVELRTNVTTPKLTTEKARTMGVRERISTYTTTYDPSNKPRVNNIHLLGDSLDGTLIEPGGTFSFNEAAGERTASKGYQEANAIVNGKLVPQLGGGVCQVGTTVFNAVFESGFPVIERRNHSFYISHYPTGRDATVSWGGPDLKFKNDSDNYVLVSVSYTAGSITVSLYGTDPGYEVAAKTGEWSDEKPYGIETVKDPTMYVGTKYVEDRGITGRTITVQRIVSKDGKVMRTDDFKSVYKPKAQVVRVGTKPKSSSTTSRTP